MKILFFSPYFYPYTSGITEYSLRIIKHLSKKNQITVLTFNHLKNKKEEKRIENFKIIRMPYLIKIYKGFISPQSIFYFFSNAKKSDLIIINLPNVEGSFLALISKLLRKKTFVILHCFLASNKNVVLRIINSLANLFVFFQLSLADKIFAYTKDYISSFPIYPFVRKKITTILPPVNKLPINKKKLDQFLKLKNKKVWIGYAGRISQEKGLEFLIKAVDLILKTNQNLQEIELVFAGPYGEEVVGEKNYFLKIKKLLEDKKLKYRFFGNLKNGDLGAFYKTIDILVLPSINSTEAFGIVQVEAMLLGTPVIATNLPGVRIPIKLTKMGIIVKPKNETELAKAILKILQNPQKYSNKNLVEKAEKIFNLKKVYQFWDNILLENK